jgi:hypothetical protein
VCPSKVIDARAAVRQNHPREELAARIEPKSENSVLALRQLISFGFRKKRHQADSGDAP